LVVADVSTAATCSAVSAAKQLGNDTIHLLQFSNGTTTTAVPEGTTKVIQVQTSSSSQRVVPETIADAIQTVIQSNAAADADNVSHVVMASTKFGNSIIPRAAALFKSSPITDVIRIDSPNTYMRPMYAGNVWAKIQASDEIQFVSIRPTSFDAVPIASAAPESTEISVSDFPDSVWVSENASSSGRPDLGSAKIVVSGGRGMGSAENFQILEKLVDALGGEGAVGASRAAVDAGMAPNECQVGQTGKVVAPDLYVAVGISGAIQHVSGMKESKTIVAINKDPEAPIFQIADYGLAADLFQAVPELTEKIAARK
jgi:electron transfer flavoprotein alpha subunit